MQYVQPYLLCSFKEATANAPHARGTAKEIGRVWTRGIVWAWPRSADKESYLCQLCRTSHHPCLIIIPGFSQELSCWVSSGFSFREAPGLPAERAGEESYSSSSSPPDRWLLLSRYLAGVCGHLRGAETILLLVLAERYVTTGCLLGQEFSLFFFLKNIKRKFKISICSGLFVSHYRNSLFHRISKGSVCLDEKVKLLAFAAFIADYLGNLGVEFSTQQDRDLRALCWGTALCSVGCYSSFLLSTLCV